MARQQLDFGVFQDSEGSPLALGYLTVRLNTDAVSNSGDQVCAGQIVRVDLDADGLISGSAEFWPNSQLTPSGTTYQIMAYTARGQRVWESESVTFTASGLLLQETSFDFVLEDGSGFIALES